MSPATAVPVRPRFALVVLLSLGFAAACVEPAPSAPPLFEAPVGHQAALQEEGWILGAK